MLNVILDNLTEFLNISRTTFDSVLSIIVYLGLIIISLKSGATGTTLIIGYLVVSAVLTALGIDSFLNVMTLIKDLIKEILRAFNPFTIRAFIT